jgi:hypothetical protein
MKVPKDEKLQVLLSSDDHHKLKSIILRYSMVNGKLMTASSYIRELIRDHIKEYEGEQRSFVNDTVREIIAVAELEKQKNEKQIT